MGFSEAFAMKRRKRWLLLLIAIVLMLGLLTAVAVFVPWWQANQRLCDYHWWMTASREEKVRTAHQVLSFPWGNHHDAFIFLIEDGGPESVPILINALRWQPNSSTTKGIECTKDHCLEALKRITGHDAGEDYADWVAWWESVGRRLPAKEE